MKTKDQLKFLNFARRQFSTKAFQKHSEKSLEEIERIIEQEQRLGILSAINYAYPFAGQSRPIIQNSAKKVTVELDVEEYLPLTPAMEQIIAVRAFERNAQNLEDETDSNWRKSPFRKITTTDLLEQNPTLEKNILVEPLLLWYDVTSTFTKCPQLIELNLIDLPSSKSLEIIQPVSSFKTTEMNLLKLDFCPLTATNEIVEYMRAICHFLQARGYYANAVDPSTGKAIFNTSDGQEMTILPIENDNENNLVNNFDVEECFGSILLKYNKNDNRIPGAIITDAPETDRLVGDLIYLPKFKTAIVDFLYDGMMEEYIDKNGVVIDVELAKERHSKVFPEDFFDLLDGRFDRYLNDYYPLFLNQNRSKKT